MQKTVHGCHDCPFRRSQGPGKYDECAAANINNHSAQITEPLYQRDQDNNIVTPAWCPLRLNRITILAHLEREL